MLTYRMNLYNIDNIFVCPKYILPELMVDFDAKRKVNTKLVDLVPWSSGFEFRASSLLR